MEYDKLAGDAAMDQAAEGQKGMAFLLWNYYTALIAEGFSYKQAFTLVRDYQSRVIPETKGTS